MSPRYQGQDASNAAGEANQLLTPHEAAQALRISARKLWELKDTGEISHVRIGRLVRYPAASIRKFISERATAGTKS
ncbi:helix-turn-helix domain-containing protein [Aeoliella sp. ICT_H6.2]|uniref:Helix-turn-helix domain-containing protein n=1 Tax=Aeoliella straminimaris TaxID=2954799 RepID=A0A9X2JJS0_9BACT|nr:helix-turn-helix domain-containing protein [Aeoliella straminimaris]MCO6047952.1 helix-turn-helix domain-containing protein [Aeoliella straminimaris]